MNKKLKNKLVIIISLVAVLALVVLLKTRQSKLSQALTPTVAGDIVVEQGITENGMSKVRVMFKTGSQEEEPEYISTITLKLRINEQDGRVVNFLGNEITNLVISEQLDGEEDWVFPVNAISYSESGIEIELAAVNKTFEGYAISEYTELATFYLKNTASNTPNVSIDPEYSKLYSKDRPVTDIWELKK